MTKLDKGELYQALLAYPDLKRIPYGALAEKFKVSQGVIRGLVGSLVRGTSKALESLREVGYDVEELPRWVGSKSRISKKASQDTPFKPQEMPTDTPIDTPPKAQEMPLDTLPEPKPDMVRELEDKRLYDELERLRALEKRVLSGEPIMSGMGSGMVSGMSSRDVSNTISEGGSGITSSPPLPSAMGDALQLLNQKEEGSIIEYQGRRFRVVEAGGEMKLAPVTQTKVLADEALSAAMSKAIIENIEVNMLTIAKKVALSPVVVIGHGIVTSMRDTESGLPYFEGDIGDFINWSCSFALKTAFGIRIGVITGAPSLMSAMKTLKNQSVEMRDVV